MPERDVVGELHPCLIPMTAEARDSVGNKAVPIEHFPYRIGRDLRDPLRTASRFFHERRRSEDTGPNDLYLHESGRRHRISREHLLIGRQQDGFYIEDRQSACGTLVDGEQLGGKREGGRRPLVSGDVILLGGKHSPFAFKFAGSDALEN